MYYSSSVNFSLILELNKTLKHRISKNLTFFSLFLAFSKKLNKITQKDRLHRMPLPSEEATELVDVEVAEDAPKAVARGELGAERARVPEEETNVRELGLEPREEG
jgi:hypothetical protein